MKSRAKGILAKYIVMASFIGWSLTGRMNFEPFAHAATVLNNDQVLVSGGLAVEYPVYISELNVDP